MRIHTYLIVIPLILLVTRTNFKEAKSVDSVNAGQKILNQKYISSDVLGHNPHQIVTLVNTTGEKIFGIVNFNSTFPVDIIAYKITSNNTAPSNLCSLSGSYYTTDNLLSYSTQRKVEFTGYGLVAHLSSHDGFPMNFTIRLLQSE